MSKDILALDPKQLEALASQAVDTEASASGSVQMINTRGGRMSLKGMPIVGDKIMAVILTSPIERNYYEGVFDSAASAPPDCFAIGYDGGEIGPSPRVVTPQSPNCFSCPKNQWGSSTQGSRKGKACKETRKIIFLDIENVPSPDKVASAPVYGIRPPVTSVTAFGNYVKQMAITLKKPPFGFVTEISLMPDNKNQFRMEFKFISEIKDNQMLLALMERSNREKQVILGGEGYQAEAADESVVDEETAF